MEFGLIRTACDGAGLTHALSSVIADPVQFVASPRVAIPLSGHFQSLNKSHACRGSFLALFRCLLIYAFVSNVSVGHEDKLNEPFSLLSVYYVIIVVILLCGILIMIIKLK